MAVNIGPKIGIEGEAEYRKQINSIIQQSKLLASEMKALTTSFDKNGKTLEQNARQHKILEEQIKNQESKISSMKDMVAKATKAYEDSKEELMRHKDALTEDAEATKAMEKAVEANAAKLNKYQTDLNNATADLNKMKGELDAMPSSLDLVAAKMEAMGQKLETIGGKISSVGSKLTSTVTTGIAAAFGASVKSAIDWESAFTGVMKTVDETANTTYDDLKKSINQMAETTASSQNEIAATMEIAGQLGVSADKITEFTRAVVMLGDTTNLSSEEAASAVAKFANVTNMSLEDVDKFGSALVDLGNNYATSEADIMSMATRLSGAGAQIGLTQGEILGFATALSSVGIEAEMGGSAFSKAMIKMQVAAETGFDQVNALSDKTGMSLRELELLSSNNSKDFKALADSLGLTKEEMNATIKAGKNLNDFAEVASMSTEDFVELYRKDAPAALQAFIQGLGDVEGHGESTIAMLQEMGFTEVRLRDTLTRLANSGDLVTDAVAQGNTAWGENSAMAAEAAKRYATMESKINQLKARFTEMAVSFGELIIPSLEKFMGKVQEVIDHINGMDDAQKQQIIKFAAIAAAIGPVLIVVGKLVTAIGSIMKLAPMIATAFKGIAVAVGGVSAPVLAVVAVIVAAIALLVGAFKHLWDNNEAFRESMIGIWNGIKESFNGFIDQVKSRLPALQEGFSKIISVIGPIWDGFCNLLAPAFEGAFKAVKAALDALFNAIVAILDMIIAVFQGDKEAFMLGLNNFLLAIKTLFLEWWTIFWTWVLETINVVLAWFGTSTEEIMTIIKTFLTELGAKIVEKVTEIVDFVTEKIDAICDFIASLPEKFYNWGVEMMQNLIDGIKSMIGEVASIVEEVASTVADFLHFSEPDKGPLSNFNSWMPDMMKQMAEQIEGGRYQVQVAAGHVAADIAAPIAGSRTVTLNNNFSFQGGYTEADGRSIVRQINRQLGALYI